MREAVGPELCRTAPPNIAFYLPLSNSLFMINFQSSTT